MVLGDLVSDESPLLDLYIVVFSLYLPMVGGVRELSGASFLRVLITFMRAPLS